MVSRVPMSPPGSSKDLFGTLQREVNRVFDQMFGSGGGLASPGGFAPSLEMTETEGGLVVTAELPGLEEKDVEVSLEGKSARVIYDEGLIDLDALKAAILEEGYQVA